MRRQGVSEILVDIDVGIEIVMTIAQILSGSLTSRAPR